MKGDLWDVGTQKNFVLDERARSLVTCWNQPPPPPFRVTFRCVGLSRGLNSGLELQLLPHDVGALLSPDSLLSRCTSCSPSLSVTPNSSAGPQSGPP